MTGHVTSYMPVTCHVTSLHACDDMISCRIRTLYLARMLLPLVGECQNNRNAVCREGVLIPYTEDVTYYDSRKKKCAHLLVLCEISFLGSRLLAQSCILDTSSFGKRPDKEVALNVHQ